MDRVQVTGERHRLVGRWSVALRRPQWTFLFSAAAVSFYFTSRSNFPIHLDDSLITLTYVKNLISGRGFVFNPGERVMGYSNPAYALFVALFSAMRIPIEDVANWGFLLTSAGLVFALGWVFLKVRVPELGPLACLFFMGSPEFWLSLKGMETSLLVLLATVSSGLLLRRRFLAAAVCAGFASLCRPDAIVISVL